MERVTLFSRPPCENFEAYRPVVRRSTVSVWASGPDLFGDI